MAVYVTPLKVPVTVAVTVMLLAGLELETFTNCPMVVVEPVLNPALTSSLAEVTTNRLEDNTEAAGAWAHAPVVEVVVLHLTS